MVAISAGPECTAVLSIEIRLILSLFCCECHLTAGGDQGMQNITAYFSKSKKKLGT